MAEQKLTFVEKYLAANSAGSVEALAVSAIKNQVIETNDANTQTFNAVGKDIQTLVQQQDKIAFYVGTGSGPFTWTDEALAIHAQEPEIICASDVAEELYVISNFNDGTDTPGIWQLVPEQSDASFGGAPQKWIIKDFKILPSVIAVTTPNPQSAVIIQGQIYIAGPLGSGAAAGSGANREMFPYSFSSNTYGAVDFTFDGSNGDARDLAYDGANLYGLIFGATVDVFDDHIQQWKWDSASAQTLIQRFRLDDVPEMAAVKDLTPDAGVVWDPRGMAVDSSGRVYIANNSNNNLSGGVIVEAFIYICRFPETTGLDNRIRCSYPLTANVDRLDKGQKPASLSNSVGTIAFTNGAAIFTDGTSERIVMLPINRGGAGSFGASNSFSIAVTVTPSAITANMTVCAFTAGATEKLFVDGDQWQYNYNGQNVSGIAEKPIIGVTQRLIVVFDSEIGTGQLTLFSKKGTADAIVIQTKANVGRDTDGVSSMVIGAVTASGGSVQGFEGEISVYAIYDFAVDPDDEPSLIPIIPSAGAGGIALTGPLTSVLTG